MIHHTVFMNTLRTARYFLSIQINPQTLIRIGRDSHRFQKTNNTLQIVFKQGLRCRFYKSKINISLIMVNCTTSRNLRAKRMPFSIL